MQAYDERDPFVVCPVYETERFSLRKLVAEDALLLLDCYSDPEAARFFNGDNCGDSFYYEDLSAFKKCVVDYWLKAYRIRDYVRWTVLDQRKSRIIGTVELCPAREQVVEGKKIGILRIDLHSDYEQEPMLLELLHALNDHLYEDFGLYALLSKFWPEAAARVRVAERLGFVPISGHHQIPFPYYYIRLR